MKKFCYQTRLVSMADVELEAYEIKIPENVLKVFTPNVIGRLLPICRDATDIKIIPIKGNVVYVSTHICNVLQLDMDLDVIALGKVVKDDEYCICTKTCDAVEDKSLKENTIVVPKVILDEDFRPDYITTFPMFDGPIEYNSINIKTTNSSTVKVSTDIARKMDLILNPQLCFWIKEEK
mgnify:CR=1 FL=1